MTTNIPSPTQQLQQAVCQKFGWSCVYHRNNENDDNDDNEDKNNDEKAMVMTGTWTVTVSTGMHQRRSFTTKETYEDDKTGEKAGKAAVSKLALDGLHTEIARMEALPVQELTQVFAAAAPFTHSPLRLWDSYDSRTWPSFWKNPPSVVGIDTEGNQISPPVLVQVAFGDNTVILETPHGSLSEDLQRLLCDDSITKVFCDNFAHKDKRCLGISRGVDNKTKNKEEGGNSQYVDPPIVDIELLAMEPLGIVKSPRGLGRLVTLTMPEIKVRIEKPKVAKGTSKGRFANISRFARIEQGKAKPLEGLGDLSLKDQKYAALDAWCTLRVYERLQKDQQSGTNRDREGTGT